jgi:hypothetical protein
VLRCSYYRFVVVACAVGIFFFKQTTLFIVVATYPYVYNRVHTVCITLPAPGGLTLHWTISRRLHSCRCAWVSWAVCGVVYLAKGVQSPQLSFTLGLSIIIPRQNTSPCPGRVSPRGQPWGRPHRRSRYFPVL